MIDTLIEQLVQYGLHKGLILQADAFWARNSLLGVLKLEALRPVESMDPPKDVRILLEQILDWAHANGRLESRYAEHSDLLDTKLMGCLTPRPSEINREFQNRYTADPVDATQWFYQLCQEVQYIRTDRVARNQSWQVHTDYGCLDITINCSKPEKDPKAIAAAAQNTSSDYPACLLCLENVGYAGRTGHPARQNLRVIPVTLNGEPWYFQYSPYVYYNEHAIIFSEKHIPMAITRETFVRLLDFIEVFPHYFIGSNADLPIVGGSMLTHDHYQGGRYEFAMERAATLEEFTLRGYPGVSCARLNWPLTVLRLTSADRNQLLEAADTLRKQWRQYSDPGAGILAETEGVPHNTLTPIARRRGEAYQLDLVLRNNRQSKLYPDGIFHPHPEIHAVKKENIGLIEVMGLAVLPDRLVPELEALEALIAGHHLPAASELPEALKKFDYLLTCLGAMELTGDITPQEALRRAVGHVFVQGMEHCGVYSTGSSGSVGIRRFIQAINSGV